MQPAEIARAIRTPANNSSVIAVGLSLPWSRRGASNRTINSRTDRAPYSLFPMRCAPGRRGRRSTR